MLDKAKKLREVTVQQLLDLIKLESRRLFPQRHDEQPAALYLKHLVSLRDEINNHACALNHFCPGQVTVDELLISVQQEQNDVSPHATEPEHLFYRSWLRKLEMDIFELAEICSSQSIR